MGDVLLQFVHLPENVGPKVIRDIITVQYFLPMSSFEPRLLMNTPLQFAENALWQAEPFKCRVCQLFDCVRMLFPNNWALVIGLTEEVKNIPCSSSGSPVNDDNNAGTAEFDHN